MEWVPLTTENVVAIPKDHYIVFRGAGCAMQGFYAHHVHNTLVNQKRFWKKFQEMLVLSEPEPELEPTSEDPIKGIAFIDTKVTVEFVANANGVVREIKSVYVHPEVQCSEAHIDLVFLNRAVHSTTVHAKILATLDNPTDTEGQWPAWEIRS